MEIIETIVKPVLYELRDIENDFFYDLQATVSWNLINFAYKELKDSRYYDWPLGVDELRALYEQRVEVLRGIVKFWFREIDKMNDLSDDEYYAISDPLEDLEEILRLFAQKLTNYIFGVVRAYKYVIDNNFHSRFDDSVSYEVFKPAKCGYDDKAEKMFGEYNINRYNRYCTTYSILDDYYGAPPKWVEDGLKAKELFELKRRMTEILEEKYPDHTYIYVPYRFGHYCADIGDDITYDGHRYKVLAKEYGEDGLSFGVGQDECYCLMASPLKDEEGNKENEDENK